MQLFLVHHMDDVKSCLEKCSSAINGLSIIDCNFLNMEVLKPIFFATSLIGIRITGSYQLVYNIGVLVHFAPWGIFGLGGITTF